MLRANQLSYGPPGAAPLHRGLSAELHPGELLHLSGDNGAGKSFLLRILLGLTAPRAGSVENSFAGYRYLPQMQNRVAHLPYTLGELISHRQSCAQSVALGLLPAEQMPRAWNRASGGERQRTLLTRFFLDTGDLLVLDEPFNHLDTSARDLVRNLLVNTLREDPRRAAILISHDDQPAQWLRGIPLRDLDLSSPGAK